VLTSSNRLEPLHQPLHIDAHSTIDNWQSKMHAYQRSESVPIIPQQLYIEPQSRIDTWRKVPDQPISSFSKSIHQPMHVQARSKIDTWTSENRSKTVHTRRMVCIQVHFEYFSFYSDFRLIIPFIQLDKVKLIAGQQYDKGELRNE
jgi:hypothetical protein